MLCVVFGCVFESNNIHAGQAQFNQQLVALQCDHQFTRAVFMGVEMLVAFFGCGLRCDQGNGEGGDIERAHEKPLGKQMAAGKLMTSIAGLRFEHRIEVTS